MVSCGRAVSYTHLDVYKRQLSGCTKDEVLDQYNNIVQSAGSIALTVNSSLQGTKEKGIDDYTGCYTADY